jgi:hypothetical protein
MVYTLQDENRSVGLVQGNDHASSFSILVTIDVQRPEDSLSSFFQARLFKNRRKSIKMKLTKGISELCHQDAENLPLSLS